MATRGRFIAVECTRLWLTAVEAALGGDGLRVHRSGRWQVPAALDTDDTDAVGRWLAKTLSEAGMRCRRTVLAVPRTAVVLKKLSLPRTEHATDVPDMVRLAMTRQLTVSSSYATVDYLQLEDGVSNDHSEMSVLAAAVPGELVDWYRAVAKSAGLKVARIALRSAGLAALLSPVHTEAAVDADDHAPDMVLGVEVDEREVGLIVLRDDDLIFARATEHSAVSTQGADDDETENDLPANVAMEARRTWMSYRVMLDAGEINRAMVIGPRKLADPVAERIEHTIKMSTQVFDVHPQIHTAEDLADNAWPLAGLLLDLWRGREAMDFARPRQAPDRAQALRQRALLVAAAVIIVGGCAWSVMRRDLAKLDARYERLAEEYRQLSQQSVGLLRQEARLRHVQLWEQAKVDWLTHLQRLASLMPDAKSSILNGVSGRGEAWVLFNRPSSRRYQDGEWRAGVNISFAMSGQAGSRDVADALRGRFVDDPVYNCEPVGSDSRARGNEHLSARFNLKLETSEQLPPLKAIGGRADAGDNAGEEDSS